MGSVVLVHIWRPTTAITIIKPHIKPTLQLIWHANPSKWIGLTEHLYVADVTSECSLVELYVYMVRVYMTGWSVSRRQRWSFKMEWGYAFCCTRKAFDPTKWVKEWILLILSKWFIFALKELSEFIVQWGWWMGFG